MHFLAFGVEEKKVQKVMTHKHCVTTEQLINSTASARINSEGGGENLRNFKYIPKGDTKNKMFYDVCVSPRLPRI